MDIKDFILIGGGLLIAAVVVHGFWIAWKARRDPLRIDLVTDLPEADDEDDMRRLRGELPNGGARVVGQGPTPTTRVGADRDEPVARPRQGALWHGRGRASGGADAPVLLEPSEPGHVERKATPARKTEPRLDPLPADLVPADRVPAEQPGTSEQTPTASRPPLRERPGGALPQAKTKTPERAVKADEPKEPRRWSARKPVPQGREQRSSARGSRSAAGQSGPDARKGEQPVEELIVVNVLAPKGKPFVGGGLVEALRARGLRYGEMNIFHRQDPMTRTSLYSVANVVEPGTFDLADLDSFRSPGVCFFLQLPGPEQPLEVFEDMVKAARDVAVRVGGEVKDEQRSVMTGQTVEHYRQRISDFCRRRMSMRA